MDDTSALRRTVRRCTAVLLVGLAFVGGQAGGSSAVIPAGVLALGAALYLVVSLVYDPGPGEPAADGAAAGD